VHAIFFGIGLGVGIGAQIGPMSLFLIRNTLRSGWVVGLAIGSAIALVDGLYAAAGAAGVAPLLDIAPLRLALSVIGAVVVIYLGVRTLLSAWRIRAGGETAAESATPRVAFLTALGGTASNPVTIISWAAVFAAASTGGAARTTRDSILLVFGVTIGSFIATGGIASLTAVSRRALGRRAMRLADAIAGLALLGFGGALGFATARDS
jgi:putative LysE/RhtB family amino acid efflux pump